MAKQHGLMLAMGKVCSVVGSSFLSDGRSGGLGVCSATRRSVVELKGALGEGKLARRFDSCNGNIGVAEAAFGTPFPFSLSPWGGGGRARRGVMGTGSRSIDDIDVDAGDNK